MIVECFVVGPFQENTWLLGDEPGGHAIVIDPGGENARVLERVAAHGLTVDAIVNTHAHIDHIAGVGELVETLGVPFRLHADDHFLVDHADEACAMFGLPPIRPVPLTAPPLTDGEHLRVGELDLTVIHTPGHSPGGCSLRVGGHLFAGDTLFAGSIGRTDLPGGDYDTLIHSIVSRLLEPLPSRTIVHSGHGPDTTLAEEAATNPFLRSHR
ncbi:MAG: MBL fold metallo-hydrolase [Candidatus Krumholzibacteriia bacterium]|nr:MBL fold metallo-hydrolase [bacterium]